MPTAADRKFDLLSLGTFAVLGLPDGMLGTAWPAMRHSFGAPVGDLGLILLINTIGSVAVAAIENLAFVENDVLVQAVCRDVDFVVLEQQPHYYLASAERRNV